MGIEKPYIEKQTVVTTFNYNPNFGDDKVCVCSHVYYRHFDSWDEMSPIGCKYCSCWEFKLISPDSELSIPDFKIREKSPTKRIKTNRKQKR